MAYTVSNILKDIVYQIGNTNLGKIGGETNILRRMNQVYKRLNSEHKGCHQEFVADWVAAGGADFVALPNDWIKAYNMNPFMDWRMPSVWRNDEKYTYTIDTVGDVKRVYASEASDTFLINFDYYSMGLTLVNSTSPTAGVEVNEPEWPEELKQLLFYETLLEIGHNVTPYYVEQRNALIGKMAMRQVGAGLQATGPNVSGPQRRNSSITNPYTRTS